MTKYIIVTGGSFSGIGKGTLVCNIGIIVQSFKLNTTVIKIDPYYNIDAGTISPEEHGEVFVTGDGEECDLDIGNYERALNIILTRNHNITSGKIMKKILDGERNGDFLGSTVQMIPHVADCIQNTIYETAKIQVNGSNSIPDICIVEVGGTAGDIESAIYLQAIHQMVIDLGKENIILCHLVYLPTISHEQKTKAAQQSFKALREAGLFPEIIFARSETPIYSTSIKKLALFGGVPNEHVISIHNCVNFYCIIDMLLNQNVDKILMKLLNYNIQRCKLDKTSQIYNYSIAYDKYNNTQLLPIMPKIAFIIKYTESNDAYISLVKAIEYSSLLLFCNTQLIRINAEHLESTNSEEYNNSWNLIKRCNGILVPGGFGVRGTEGKLRAIKYARENNIPFLGICLGFQLACIEGVCSLAKIENVSSDEFQKSDNNVIIHIDSSNDKNYNKTMRLGSNVINIVDYESILYKVYNAASIIERHRHRYEFNASYKDVLVQYGYKFAGISEGHIESIEYTKNNFFVGVQFHPEYIANLTKPHPLISSFIQASHEKIVELA